MKRKEINEKKRKKNKWIKKKNEEKKQKEEGKEWQWKCQCWLMVFLILTNTNFYKPLLIILSSFKTLYHLLLCFCKEHNQENIPLHFQGESQFLEGSFFLLCIETVHSFSSLIHNLHLLVSCDRVHKNELTPNRTIRQLNNKICT